MDEAKLEQFMGQAVTDLGAAISGLMIYLGDRLGLYKAMAGAGPLSPAEVAKRSGTDERYVREWLCNQAAGGYVSYQAVTGMFELPDEQAMALADEDSPVFVGGGYWGIAAAWAGSDKFEEAFRTGKGVGWHEQDQRLFKGTERFFRPGYRAHLVSEWIPALDGVHAKLERGAKAADIGCGYGASTICMAQAYPNSEFVGFDYHDASIAAARQAATDAGLGDRVRFAVAAAKDFAGDDYDLIAYFDCLHDMGDPAGAVAHAHDRLAPDGTVLLVEPYASDQLTDNFNPLGRTFFGLSTVICCMASRSQEVGLALGAQAGEQRWREIFSNAGFGTFQRATETPFNLVLEAKL